MNGRVTFVAVVLVVCLAACSDSEEAERVSLDLVVDGSGVAQVTNDEGYEISLTTARLAIEDVELTTGGETHSWYDPVLLERLFVGVAQAHPGHTAGGETLGELRGSYLVDFIEGDGNVLGTAEAIAGRYDGANFTFAGATTESADDPLDGYSAHFVGEARRDGEVIPFDIVIDAVGTSVIGAPFDADLSGTSSAQLRLLTDDPFEDDTLFDGLDFGQLPLTDGVAVVRPVEAAHNILRRTLVRHDHYELSYP